MDRIMYFFLAFFFPYKITILPAIFQKYFSVTVISL